MNNKNDANAINFGDDVGFILYECTEEELKPIWDEVNEITKNNFLDATPHNKYLAGNIEHEYILKKCVSHVSDLIMPLINVYDQAWPYLSELSILNKSMPIAIDSLWVNFQKKHEFNPPHVHSGLMSFVIWLDIPYDIEDEMNVNHSKNSNVKIPGHFQFLYTNSLGKICTHNIPVDKKYNGMAAVFPSNLTHAVYPFTTSDEYRITISGNYKFNV